MRIRRLLRVLPALCPVASARRAARVVFRAGALAFACAASLAGCATRAVDDAAPIDRAAAEQWAANGWLTPGRAGEPEIIGLYVTRAECEAALADWLTRQVVGNPVHGECLPIDRN